MKLSVVKAHILKNRTFDNWESEVAGRWKIEDLRADPGYCNDWISFDCLAWDPGDHLLYIGLTSINNDIFHVFNPDNGRFTSLGFQTVGDKFDAKFHRSLELGPGEQFYAATALLHDMDQQRQAKGGKLLCYDPAHKSYQILGIPVPGSYIQSIALDRQRGLIYGFTYPAEQFFCHDLKTGETRHLAYVGNSVIMCQPHAPAIDTRGRIWATWGESRAFEDQLSDVPVRIFSYDPDADEFTWYQHGFPKVSPEDPARIDHMFQASDGWIYAGTVAGGFSRLDPQSGAVEDLGKPYPGPRLAGLVEGPGGQIYGAGNTGYGPENKGEARLFSFDPRTKDLQDLGPIFDPSIGMGAAKIHMLVATEDGILYAGENDNIYRSSYLWELRLE